MAERHAVRLGQEIDGELVGSVQVDVPQEMVDAFDVVLAPVITLRVGDPDSTPQITGWQLIPRTSVDTRPRNPVPPHLHVGEGPKT